MEKRVIEHGLQEIRCITLIIGRNSNLTSKLQKKIDNAIVISARELLQNRLILDEFKNKKINIIFNNFQPATGLKLMNNCHQYISISILTTSVVLDKLKDSLINKVIYTSSSSVYGDNILCDEEDDIIPLNLHTSLKIANEKLIKSFCNEYNIDYTIARIFNMYGGNDNFSIISKLIKSYNGRSVLTLINNGSSIRDFIHIDDVVDIYVKLLETKKLNILNIGTGVGISIKDIVDYLFSRNILIKTASVNAEEIKISCASQKLLYKKIGKKKFTNVCEFIEGQLVKEPLI